MYVILRTQEYPLHPHHRKWGYIEKEAGRWGLDPHPFVLRVLGKFGETVRGQLLRVALLFCVNFGCFFPPVRWNYWFVKGFSNECKCNFPCCTNLMEEEHKWGLLCTVKKSRICLIQTMYGNELRLSWRKEQVHQAVPGPLSANWSSTGCIAAVRLQRRHTEVVIRLVHPE